MHAFKVNCTTFSLRSLSLQCLITRRAQVRLWLGLPVAPFGGCGGCGGGSSGAPLKAGSGGEASQVFTLGSLSGVEKILSLLLEKCVQFEKPAHSWQAVWTVWHLSALKAWKMNKSDNFHRAYSSTQWTQCCPILFVRPQRLVDNNEKKPRPPTAADQLWKTYAIFPISESNLNRSFEKPSKWAQSNDTVARWPRAKKKLSDHCRPCVGGGGRVNGRKEQLQLRLTHAGRCECKCFRSLGEKSMPNK